MRNSAHSVIMREAAACSRTKPRKLPKIEREALLCPFCAAPAEIEPWHGGGPNKRMIRCSSETCQVSPSVTGHNRSVALRRWNTRASHVRPPCDEVR